MEEFEDNPEEYIRKDIEKSGQWRTKSPERRRKGWTSDSATRRRAACDFLQALCIFFESQVVAIYSQYIDVMQKVRRENSHSSLSFIFSLGIFTKSHPELVEERYLHLPRFGSGVQRRNSKSASLSLSFLFFNRRVVVSSSVSPRPVRSSVFRCSTPQVSFLNCKLLTVGSPLSFSLSAPRHFSSFSEQSSLDQSRLFEVSHSCSQSTGTRGFARLSARVRAIPRLEQHRRPDLRCPRHRTAAARPPSSRSETHRVR